MSPIGSVGRSVRGGRPPIPELPTEDIVHRYDAREISADDGDSVSTWVDQTGNDNLTGNASYAELGINNNPSIEADGVDDEYNLSGDPLYGKSGTYTFAIVIEPFDPTNDDGLFGDTRSGLRLEFTDGGFALTHSDETSITNFGSLEADTPTILVVSYDGSDVIAEQDNTEVVREAAGFRPFDTDGYRFLVVSAVGFYDGYMSEVVFYDGHYDSDGREQIYNHLHSKWGPF